MKKVSIAYIGGGSKAWAQILMKDLLLQDQLCGTVKLYDIDFEAASINQKLLQRLAAHEMAESSWEIEVYETLESVLLDSDFVVLSILPGTFEDMDKDVHLPEKYGIYQSVGDSVGPGGYSRAIRVFENYDPIVEGIKAFAPDAWVINYTNPMSLSMKFLYSKFPEIKAIGCCHEVFGTQKLLAKAYREFSGEIAEIDRHEIEVNVQGINHFTWINHATYNGEDLLPYYEKFVNRYSETGNQAKGQTVAEKKVGYFDSLDKVKMDLFKRFGVVAAAGDRHLAEFMVEDYLASPQQAREDWGFDLTPVSWRIANDRELIEKREQAVKGIIPVTLEKSDEEGANIMIALSGEKTFITNANYPNVGQVPDLPNGTIVETNICFKEDSIEPVFAGHMTPEVLALVEPFAIIQSDFVKSWIKSDKDGMYKSFCEDPSIKRLSEENRKKLFNKLITT